MKRIYEQPIMMTELYKVNTYCGACNKTLNGYLTTSSNNAYRNDSGGKWRDQDGAPFGLTTGNLTHVFNPTPDDTSTGLCGNGTQHADKSQSIWKCDCAEGVHPNETWFLEWSHYYSVHLNGGNSVFFLYKDANGNGTFDIVSQGGNYPTKGTGTDINVAKVEYDTIMVVNS